MTLTKAVLPSSVKVGGRTYGIKTDFRHALLFMLRIKDNSPVIEFDFMYDGEPPEDRISGIKEIIKFLNPHTDLPRIQDETSGEILLDYEKDASLIFAAFWECYGIDLLSPECRLHWHKFRALLDALHDTKLNEIQRFRAYRPDAKDGPAYKREMLRLKEMWRIEPELTEEEKRKLAEFDKALGA